MPAAVLDIAEPVHPLPRDPTRCGGLAILGGGPGGLAAGYFARKAGLPFCICEAQDRVGGNATTFREGEFRFDSGAHRWHDKDAEMTAEVRHLLGADLLQCAVPSQILHEGRWLDFPLSPLSLLGALGLRTCLVGAVDVLRAGLVAAAMVAFGLHAPSFRIRENRLGDPRLTARWLGLGAALFLALAIGITVPQQGWHETLLDLLQFRTRDDRLGYGTHWQYHLLHLLDAFAYCLACAYLVRGLSGQATARARAGGVKRLGLWCAVFAASILVFSPTLRPFSDPLYLAHQFREIATGRVLLLPTTFGLLYALERRAMDTAQLPPLQPRRFGQGLILLAMGTSIPAWIAWQLRHTAVVSLAQQHTSLAELYAAHNLEHCLDVIFALLLTGCLYLRRLPRAAEGSASGQQCASPERT